MVNNIIIEPLTTEEAFRKFSEILKTGEKSPSVRNAVITGVCNQLRRGTEKINVENNTSYLREFLNKLTRNEIDEIVKTLTDVYLQQRENLEGGDEEIEVNGRHYQIWLNLVRPQTAIEEVILEWLGNKKYPIAQQMAMQAKVEFANALDQEEEKRIQEILEERGRSKEQTALTAPTPVEQRSFGFIGTIATFWGAKPYKPVISNLLPEALKQNKSRPGVFNFVLSRWKNDTNSNRNIPDNLKLGTISHRLDVGLWLAEYWSLWLIGGSLVVWGTVSISFNVLNQLISSIPQSTPSIKNPLVPNNPSVQEPDKGIFFLYDRYRVDVSDLDSPNFNGGQLTVKIINGTPDDRLWIHNQGKNPEEISVDGNNVTYKGEVIGSFEGGKGTKPLIVSLNEKSTPKAATALLHNIQYTYISNKLVIGSRKVQVQISDGSENGNSKSLIKEINITTENQVPVITVSKGKTVKENTIIPITDISINDPDSQNLTVSLAVNHGILTVKPDVAKGLTVKNINNNKTNTVNLTGTVSEINTTLTYPNAITYQGKKDFSGDDLLTVTAKDNGKTISGVTAKSLVWPSNALSPKTAEDKKMSITVTPLKLAAVINVPGDKTVKENTKLSISGISISDPNNSPNLIVTLEVANGTITVKDNVTKGLIAKDISNNGKKTLTLKGTLAQINATLIDKDAIIYRGDKDFNGKDSLNVTVNNGGNKTTSKKISINVTHLNQPPVITESEALTTNSGISISQEQAVALINMWLQAKRVMFADPYDSRPATELTTAEQYEKTIGSINSLRSDGNYYKYGVQKVDGVDKFSGDKNQVIIQVRVTEDRTLYNSNGNIDPKETDFKTRTVRYTLQSVDGRYKIAATKIIK